MNGWGVYASDNLLPLSLDSSISRRLSAKLVKIYVAVFDGGLTVTNRRLSATTRLEEMTSQV